MPKRRDAAYYRGRLKRDFRAIYDELKAGKYKSVRQAAAAAGLIRLPGRLDALKRNWTKSNNAERRAFLTWAKAGLPSRAGKAPPTVPASIVDAHGKLRPEVVGRVRAIVGMRRIPVAEVHVEMGYRRYDWRWSQILDTTRSMSANQVADLEKWLAANAHHGSGS